MAAPFFMGPVLQTAQSMNKTMANQRPPVTGKQVLAATMMLALGLLGGEKPAQADSVKYLAHAKTALAHFYSDLNGAQKSIDMAYYIFDPCSTTGKMVVGS